MFEQLSRICDTYIAVIKSDFFSREGFTVPQFVMFIFTVARLGLSGLTAIYNPNYVFPHLIEWLRLLHLTDV